MLNSQHSTDSPPEEKGKQKKTKQTKQTKKKQTKNCVTTKIVEKGKSMYLNLS